MCVIVTQWPNGSIMIMLIWQFSFFIFDKFPFERNEQKNRLRKRHQQLRDRILATKKMFEKFYFSIQMCVIFFFTPSVLFVFFLNFFGAFSKFLFFISFTQLFVLLLFFFSSFCCGFFFNGLFMFKKEAARVVEKIESEKNNARNKSMGTQLQIVSFQHQ